MLLYNEDILNIIDQTDEYMNDGDRLNGVPTGIYNQWAYNESPWFIADVLNDILHTGALKARPNDRRE